MPTSRHLARLQPPRSYNSNRNTGGVRHLSIENYIDMRQGSLKDQQIQGAFEEAKAAPQIIAGAMGPGSTSNRPSECKFKLMFKVKQFVNNSH